MDPTDGAANRFQNGLRAGLKALNLPFTDAALNKLGRHFDLLIAANDRTNLTRITDPALAALRLYTDSAAAIAWASTSGMTIETVLDVGSGAGFPALPLAILQPAWQVTAAEATGKKAAFIESTIQALNLPNIQAVHAHTDHWPDQTRFDLMTCKAVGSLATCIACAAERIATGGYVAIYKTANLSAQEVQQGASAAKQHGFEAAQGMTYSLPLPNNPGHFALHVFRRA